jgi:hypothetical protein
MGQQEHGVRSGNVANSVDVVLRCGGYLVDNGIFTTADPKIQVFGEGRDASELRRKMEGWETAGSMFIEGDFKSLVHVVQTHHHSGVHVPVNLASDKVADKVYIFRGLVCHGRALFETLRKCGSCGCICATTIGRTGSRVVSRVRTETDKIGVPRFGDGYVSVLGFDRVRHACHECGEGEVFHGVGKAPRRQDVAEFRSVCHGTSAREDEG